MDAFLEVRGLSKSFSHKPVLESLSFTLERGRNLLIQGPSGCGKSTLLRCLALLEGFETGRIRLDEETVAQGGYPPKPDRRTRLKIGMVFQHLHLWPHLTVLRNITLPLTLRGWAAEKANDAATGMLSDFDIGEKAHSYPNELSGGQQQRVALARAFVHRPELLLLDEITSNLDPENAHKVLATVESICHKGTTVVMVSHTGQTPESIKFVVLEL